MSASPFPDTVSTGDHSPRRYDNMHRVVDHASPFWQRNTPAAEPALPVPEVREGFFGEPVKVGGRPPPIPFPDLAAVNRAHAVRAEAQRHAAALARQREVIRAAVEDGRQHGYTHGHNDGTRLGFRWGCVCGGLWGGAATVIVIAGGGAAMRLLGA